MTGLRESSDLAVARSSFFSGMLIAPGMCSALYSLAYEDELSALLDELLDGVTVDHRGHVYLLLMLQRVGGEPLSDARKPRRSTASIIWGTVTCAGSKLTTASFARRLTSARLTPFSPSRAFLTAMGQAPQVIPSTERTTVDVAASETFVMNRSPRRTATSDASTFIASVPCRDPHGQHRHS
jgi:hypothetical protein